MLSAFDKHDKEQFLAKPVKKILSVGLGATLNFRKFKLYLTVFLAGHTFARVPYCVMKITTTCLSMIGRFFDTMIVASTDKECF